MNKLEETAEADISTDMETLFCSVSLDIIGKAVFNYPFDSVTKESPVIKVRVVRRREITGLSFLWIAGAPFGSS